ncbi:hypothetical protein BJ170DRAFT_90349 [Xylariales sp. AK1849]|nr:hypothetical protein BJ170DRAFT_90349 [Xylariales sp. AK1849]
MQITALISVAALAIGTNAAVIQRQGTDNPRLAQFRVFSDTGCSNLNEGFYTVDQDQSNQCNSFTDSGIPYVSIRLEDLEPAAAGCELILYSDATCLVNATNATLGTCNNAPGEKVGVSAPTWNSWQLVCPTSS